MGKNPAFQFYPNDWSRDLEEHPLQIEGAWIRICCKLWWAEPRGKLTRTLDQWAKILRITPEVTKDVINYVLAQKIADGNGDNNGEITIISRRMYRNYKDSEFNRLRQYKWRTKQTNNANITPSVTEIKRQYNDHSSSSSSSSTTNKKKNTMLDEDFWNEVKSLYTWIDIDEQITKMKGYQLTPKGSRWKITRGSVIRWLNRQDKPIEGQGHNLTEIEKRIQNSKEAMRNEHTKST